MLPVIISITASTAFPITFLTCDTNNTTYSYVLELREIVHMNSIILSSLLLCEVDTVAPFYRSRNRDSVSDLLRFALSSQWQSCT